jgi:Tol biopolymer transport system component/DNA-binding winged helix-turn-helix (wHTH) protein
LESINGNKNGHRANGLRYRFDMFEVDPANRLLLRDGKTIPLTGKVFDVLLVFAENPGRLLEKDELIEKVWPGDFVEEGNLARNVSTLRKALGEEGHEHKYIATVQGHGYRFIADVVSANSSAALPGEASIPKTPVTPGRRWIWLIAAAGACGAVILGFSLIRSSNRADSQISTIEQIRITTGGKASRAVIAPDGSTVFYTETGELKVRNLADGTSRLLIPAMPDFNFISLAVSPDGNFIYFSGRRSRVPVSLYRLPVGGGESELVVDNVYGSISFSPDGRKFAFVRRYPELNDYAMLIADADGSNLRKLAVTQRSNNFDGTPAWSPDGSTIVCTAISTDGGFHFTIVSVSVDDGVVRPVPTKRWAWLSSLVWLPDSKNLMIVGQDEKAVSAQLWRLDRTTGETRQMSDDTFIYESISGTLDGKKFVAIKRRLESHIWINGDVPVQVTTGFDKYDGLSGLAWTNDGRLIYHSRASGRDGLWRTKADGTGAEMLTDDGGGGFAISPDGNSLVFQRQESSKLGLSKLDLTTGEEKRLTDDSTDMTPAFSADGQSIVYAHFAEKHALYKVPADGGPPSKLFDEYRTVSSPTVSPDGTKIAFAFGRAQNDAIQSGIGVLSSENNRLIGTFNVVLTFGSIYERPTVQWSPDGRWINYIKYENGVSNVWKLDTNDGSLSPVTDFKTGRVFNFSFSQDGKLALARGTVESDVLILTPSE